jgi:hypothetical protein
VSNSTEPAPLSADAEELLRLAARDIYGQIYVFEGSALAEPKSRKLTAAMPHLRTAERELCWDGMPRTYARWRAALQELVHADYAEPARSDSQHVTYRLTQAGYTAADRLSSGNEAQQ